MDNLAEIKFQGELESYHVKSGNDDKEATVAIGVVLEGKDTFKNVGIMDKRYMDLAATTKDSGFGLRSDKAKEPVALLSDRFNFVVSEGQADKDFPNVQVDSARIRFSGKGAARLTILVMRFKFVCDSGLNQWMYDNLNDVLDCGLQQKSVQGTLTETE